MARVGRSIYSPKFGDNRDYFPFQFIFDPTDGDFRHVAFDLDTAFNFICRLRTLQSVIEISTTDDTVGGDPVTASLDWSQKADRLFKGPDEDWIQESFRTNYDWPGWLYDTPEFDPFNGNASVVFGDYSVCPLKYYSSNSFSPWMNIFASIDGGDPGDRTTIALLSSIQLDGFRPSEVKGYFLSEEPNFQLYESQTDPTNRYITGDIRITGIQWWGYRGVINTLTGVQEIFPTPTGF